MHTSICSLCGEELGKHNPRHKILWRDGKCNICGDVGKVTSVLYYGLEIDEIPHINNLKTELRVVEVPPIDVNPK